MNILPLNNKRNTSQGFTLVETLVAITILLLVVIGPMTIAAQGMQNAYYANEQTTAVFLAQESIEAIKKLRDNNALTYINSCTNGCIGSSWDWINKSGLVYSLPTSCSTVTGCDFDASGSSFVNCSSPSNCIILQSDGTSDGVIYGHTYGSNTIYTRTIKVTSPITGTNAVLVTVTVSWSAHVYGGNTRSVVLQTWLYDQYNITP